jgi:hypothetical protein
MSALLATIRELVGLFFDDRALGLTVLIVVAAATLLSVAWQMPAAAGGVLVVGCLAALAFSVFRSLPPAG